MKTYKKLSIEVFKEVSNKVYCSSVKPTIEKDFTVKTGDYEIKDEEDWANISFE